MSKAKIKFKQVFALALSFSMLLTGCSKKQENVPELVAPTVINSSYRPVEKGDVGSINCGFGTVVATDYCHFYKANTVVSEIDVNIGEYVNEGQILAYANVDSSKEQIERLREEISTKNSEYDYNSKIYDQNIKELQYKEQAYKDAGDISGAAEFETQIETIKENKRYDEMLKNYQVSKLNDQITELSELVADGTLKARHSGYVTFVKDLSVGNNCLSSENIVIISDFDDLYIELKKTLINEYKFKKSKVKYAKIAGVNHDIEEFDYSQEELILAKTTGCYPYQRFKLKDNVKLEMGETIPLYFCNDEARDVLKVGNDSVYTEGDQTFVYVKTDTSDKERRNVTLGLVDDNYSEVISGLTEGEQVYYSSAALVPSEYDEFKVGLDNFATQSETKSYKKMNSVFVPYISEYDGTIAEIFVNKGAEVKKGDVILSIDTGGGKAKLAETKNAISQENEAYDNNIKEIDKNISDLKKQISAYSTLAVPTATDTDALKEYLYQPEQLNCQISVLAYQKNIAEINHKFSIDNLNKEYTRLSNNNNGAGVIEIKAEGDGFISNIMVSEKSEITKGTCLFSEGNTNGDTICVTMAPSGNFSSAETRRADIGQEITFTSKNGKKYTGKCIGMRADEGRFYLQTIDDKAYETSCDMGDSKYPQFFVVMDDKSFYDNMDANYVTFSNTSINNVVMLKQNMVYTETDKSIKKEYHYVWKIIGDTLVKQYVIIDKGLVNNGEYVILSGVNEGDLLAQEYPGNDDKK